MKLQKRNYFYPAFAVCVWGSLYVVSRPVLDQIPPFTLVLIRYLLSLAVLGPLVWRLCRKSRLRIARRDWAAFLFIGIAGYGAATGAQFIGTRLAGASVASLINSMNPVTIAVFAAALLGERVTRAQLISLALAVTGALVILGGGLQGGQAAGIAVSIASVVLWSLMSVQVRRLGQSYPPLVITTVALAVASVCLLPVSWIELRLASSVVNWSLSLLPPILYMGLVCTAAAQVCWNLGLARLEAARCGLFYPLQPVVSTLLGAVVLHERFGGRFLIGGVCILGGIACSVLRSRTPAAANSQPTNLSRRTLS